MYVVVTGNCCFVSFGGLGSNFIDNIGEGCGLTPKCKGYRRPNIPEGSEGLVIFGAPSETPSPKGVVNELFGGAWNSSSRAVVKNVTGTSVATLYPELLPTPYHHHHHHHDHRHPPCTMCACDSSVHISAPPPLTPTSYHNTLTLEINSFENDRARSTYIDVFLFLMLLE